MLMVLDRAQLQEQNALSEEIVNAITSNQIGEPIDEDELDEELEAMQQEQLDEQMLKSGTVPVSDSIHRLPSVANGKSESYAKNLNDLQVANALATVESKTPVAVEEDDEEAEFRKLQAEMAM
jgi:charged multivesicular body protein 4A/B